MRLQTLFFLLLAFLSISLLESKENSQFRKTRKAELNLHLNGSYPLDYLQSIATPEQKEKLEKKLHRVAKGVPYQEFFFVFNIVEEIVNTNQKVEDGVIALCDWLEKDGVNYAEIKTKLRELDHECDCDGYLQSILEGIRKGCTENFTARVLLSVHRDSTIEFTRHTVDLALKYRHRGVVGIDISGDTLVGNIERLYPELFRAKNLGIPLTVHMGESQLEWDQVSILANLQPQRVSQGVFLVPTAREIILANRVPIEVCLTASVLMDLIDDVTQNPGLQYALLGHPIVICSDDPLIFHTSPSNELTVLYNTTLFLEEQVDQIARESFKYSFNDG
jgi:adenosine deaminase